MVQQSAPKPCLRETEAESLRLVGAVSRAARTYDEAGVILGGSARYGWDPIRSQRSEAIRIDHDCRRVRSPGRRIDVTRSSAYSMH